MFRKVFISYAKEDIKFATALYDFLSQHQFDPWLDKKKLMAGAKWDSAIRKAFKEADFIILLLSSTSVSKRGYVQREYRLALENWETRLESDIYIIPILIDACEVPDSLSQFQWIRFDDEHAFEEILRALESQRTEYLKSTFAKSILDAHYIKTLSLDLPSWLNIENNVEIPQFPQNPFFNADYVNAFIQQNILEQMSDFSTFIVEEDNYDILPEHLKPHLNFSSYYEIAFVSERYLSLILHISSYHGGSHPNYNIQTKNFSFNPVRKLKLSDVVKFNNIIDFVTDSYSKYAVVVASEYGEELIDRIREELERLESDDIDFVFNKDKLTIMPFNFLRFAFQGSGNIEIPLSELNLKITV